MQKVFKSCDMLDKKCYKSYALTEDIMMEHAAIGMEQYIRTHFTQGSSVSIIAGPGNNGADGIALARLLHYDYEVKLRIPCGVKSQMAKVQLKRAEALGLVKAEHTEDADVIVDALFGAGLDRLLDDDTIQLLHKMNSFKGYKIACDIPTGVGEDGTLMPLSFNADITLTMGAYKESLYLDESKDIIGKVERINLGICSEHYEGESNTFVLEFEDMKLPIRDKEVTHKGTFGHAAIFTGEKEGAGIICGTAATRFGAGLTTLVVHERIIAPPYLMHATTVPDGATALAIGMGLGGHFEEEFLQKYVIHSHLPIVLDADALSSLPLLSIVNQRDREIVLTPHPKEFAALWMILTGEVLKVSEVQSKRFEMVRMFNHKYPHVTLLLKGANTLIMQEESLYINPLGCAKLSKGGSGDVLSGLIVSLLAQGYPAIEAAIQGSLALAKASQNYPGASYAMIATDLIDEVAKLELC